jgi:hypothetical protein
MNNDPDVALPEVDQLVPGGPHEPTYPVSAGARALGKSERWYTQQLTAGRFPGHRAGRTWFLTTSDIASAIEATSRPVKTPNRLKSSEPPIRPIRPQRTRHRRPIPPQGR